FRILAWSSRFVCVCACPVDLSLVYRITLFPCPLDYVRRSSTLACFTDYSYVLPTLYLSAIVRPCLFVTMSLPLFKYYKSLHMDLFASRLPCSVTEYSATKGSGSFFPADTGQ
ncbi:hypothetical protein M9458_017333, partial [Cirrhinus mrigala]